MVCIAVVAALGVAADTLAAAYHNPASSGTGRPEAPGARKRAASGWG